ncbi:MAG: CerR family C-terminal domain-containing protein [Phycisphaerae bacterium]|nr:CerR family C-terminal domain-containing protein [Phycisphaerae bacterium]
MAKRKDGIRTQDRILSVACEVFAERGYHDATIEDICTRAKSNIAAINYHFGSKEQLYARVWRRAFDEAIKAYPPEGGLSSQDPPEERLRGAIYSLVGKTVDAGRIGHAGKLLLREMINPTDVIKHVKHDALQPLHERMNNLMRELLGPEASGEQILLCQMSIVHQCIAIGIRLFTGRIPAHMRLDMPSEQLAETLTEHITRFSLAGVKAVREDIRVGRPSAEEATVCADAPQSKIKI